jgi:hypothetical protein
MWVAPLLSLWPAQNGPELGDGIAEAFSHPLQKIREDFGTTRFDYNISGADTFFAVYTVDDSADNTPSANPLSTAIETLREQVASIQEQHVFSPSFLNTARFGFSRATFFFTGVTPVDLPGWVGGRRSHWSRSGGRRHRTERGVLHFRGRNQRRQ